MATTIGDLIHWLQQQNPDHLVGVDEGGLTLKVSENGDYSEIGGLPEVTCGFECEACELEWERTADNSGADNCPMCGKSTEPTAIHIYYVEE